MHLFLLLFLQARWNGCSRSTDRTRSWWGASAATTIKLSIQYNCATTRRWAFRRARWTLPRYEMVYARNVTQFRHAGYVHFNIIIIIILLIIIYLLSLPRINYNNPQSHSPYIYFVTSRVLSRWQKMNLPQSACHPRMNEFVQWRKLIRPSIKPTSSLSPCYHFKCNSFCIHLALDDGSPSPHPIVVHRSSSARSTSKSTRLNLRKPITTIRYWLPSFIDRSWSQTNCKDPRI